jgi:hypothetical protein
MTQLDTVAGIERMAKLMTNTPGPDDVLISVDTFTDIMSTVDYVMDGWCHYDRVLEVHTRRVLAHVNGRSHDAEIWLDRSFAEKIKLVGLDTLKTYKST